MIMQMFAEMWLDSIRILKPRRIVSQCCGDNNWTSEEDGYHCFGCGRTGFTRATFLMDNPNFEEEE
jgi:hypothetical protein